MGTVGTTGEGSRVLGNTVTPDEITHLSESFMYLKRQEWNLINSKSVLYTLELYGLEP
jgi:hypothetical protein